jgi:hypothetical protein
MPAISPAINPQAIVGNRPTSTQSFQNFISGGNPLGSSVVSNAANKIVGFERAAVKPVIPDINSIVNTISSNILNQVDNSIRSATNIINQNTDAKIQQVEGGVIREVQQLRTETQNNQITQLQTTVERIQTQTTNVVEKISEDYRKRVGEIDSARPNNLLTNFIQLYRTAIDFIKFFGDRRNIDTLRSNLVSLKESFTESFEVAKLIRSTIIKIVNQLSSLPTAGPGSSSGLNIDVNVPKSGMKQTLPKGARGMKGKLGMFGLGLGGLAAGGAAINALAGSRNQVEPVQTEQSIPGQILDTFSTLISRFASAVDEMVKGGENAKSGSQGSASSKSSQKGGGGQRGGGKSPGSVTSGTSGGVNAGDITADTPEEKAFIATVREAEGTAGSQGYNTFFGGSQYGGDLSTKTVMEVKQLQEKFLAEGKGRWKGGKSAAVGAGQFLYPEQIVRAMGMDPNKVKFTPELQNQMILYLAKKKRGIDVSKELTAADFKILGKEWAGLSEYHGQGGSLGRTGRLYTENLKEARGSVKSKQTPGVGGEDLPDWMLSPQKREELKLATETVSQPPPSQTDAPKITTLPLDLSGGTGGGGQQKQSGPIPAPTRQGAPGPQIPYIPSSDPENFLVLYSKIVYNIVDG